MGGTGQATMGLYNKIFGDRGEEIAARLLKKRGYRILERNYRCRYGEIDLVARDGRTIAFVEVKARRNTDFGAPADAVGNKKRLNMARASSNYLVERGLADHPARFDVVSILTEGGVATAELIKDAFSAPPPFAP
ncbi:MAG: YraN family protein [Thermodesulfobacteriota bacterium]